jgi:small subunit ribosomal protein S7e
MATARNKILKPAGVSPDELELQVAQHIFDLEQNPELRADLRGLQITAAKEVCFLNEIYCQNLLSKSY